MNTRQNHRGFTIIELLIVIVIISILVALAVPSYRDYVIRTNRTVAKVALQELATRQESYVGDHKSYAANFGRLGYGTGSADTVYVTSDNKISESSTGALYKITLHGGASDKVASCAASAVTAQGFRLDAEPLAITTDAKCGTICVSSTGEHGSSLGAAAAAECWRR